MDSLPYTILSSAISLDGYLDDTSSNRLLLSNKADFDRVDALRASCDAILVGANTIRKDNPSLNVRSESYIDQRTAKNLPKNLVKVTLTKEGNLPFAAKFFNPTDNAIYVYCPYSVSPNMQLPGHVQIVPMGQDQVPLYDLLADLGSKGVKRILIEGGQHIATAFLTTGLIDELQIAIAPFFVGQTKAPRLVGAGVYPFDQNNRMHLHSTAMVDDMAVLTYKLAID